MRRIVKSAETGGFTLIELLVVVTLFGVLGSLIASVVIRATTTSAAAQSRLVATGSAQTALERISRDARVANPLQATTSGSELILNVQRGKLCERRRWYADGTRLLQEARSYGEIVCSLASGAPAGAPTTSVVLTGLTSSAAPLLFSYFRQDSASKTVTAVIPNATTVSTVDRIVIRMSVDAYADRAPLVLSSTVDLRNVVVAQ